MTMKAMLVGCWVLAAVSFASLGCGSDDSGHQESTRALCSDGADNDRDGHVDCEDQDCVDFAICVDGGDGDADSDADGDADGEECNGLDDDGDGQIDEGSPGSGAACLTGLDGRCAEGLTGCAGGSIECFPTVQPVAEDCANSGEDDDCNGQVDDVEGEGDNCVTGLGGGCAAGTRSCFQGALVCAPVSVLPEETCPNGVDEDCDGEVDDGAGPVGESCANMGADDDCNGWVDDVPDVGNWCLTGLENRCAEGALTCVDGDLVCDGLTDPIDERCDNQVDEDCDGEVDEAGCLDPNLHHTGYGYEWIDDVPTGTYNEPRANDTCLFHLIDLGQDDLCDFDCACGEDADRSLGVSNRGIDREVRRCWFYSGPMTGLTTTESDACNVEFAHTWD